MMESGSHFEVLMRFAIGKLEQDGYISSIGAAQARDHYSMELDEPLIHSLLLSSCDQTVNNTQRSYLQLAASILSISTISKVIGVVFLLAALSNLFGLMLPVILKYLQRIPLEVFQSTLICSFFLSSIFANRLWQSQAPYVAALASFSLCLTAVWIVSTQETLARFLDDLEKRGWKLGTIISTVLLLYYSSLAVLHGSQMLGFAATVCFSSILGFGAHYTPHILSLYVERTALQLVIYGHMAAIVLYLIAKHQSFLPHLVEVFKFGIEYYCSIAMSCGFLIGTSPWPWDRSFSQLSYRILQFFSFVATWSASMYVYFFLGTKTVGSVMCVWGVFIALEWYWFLASKISVMFGLAAVGFALFAGGAVIDQHWRSPGLI